MSINPELMSSASVDDYANGATAGHESGKQAYDRYLGQDHCHCETCHPMQREGTDSWKPELKDFRLGQEVKLSDAYRRAEYAWHFDSVCTVTGLGQRMVLLRWPGGTYSWAHPGNLRHVVKP